MDVWDEVPDYVNRLRDKLLKVQAWLNDAYNEDPELGDKYWNTLQAILDA